MARTNVGGREATFPEWARAERLRISFDYQGPAEVAKQLIGYAWERTGYSLKWLHQRVTDYDRNKAAEMAAYGANAGCLVWSPGFSRENEEFHWDVVRRRIPEFRARGMHVLVYISLTNAFWREMFAAVPESAGWRQLSYDGGPVAYPGISYGNHEVSRYLLCVNHPEWRAYQKPRIAAALEAGADGIFWDNNFSSCYCPYCREGFRRFTRERMGEALEMPAPLAAEPPSEEDLRNAREVVFDWVPLSHPEARAHLALNLYRYHSVRDMLRELRRYAVSLKPDVVWSNNGHLCQDIYETANLLLSEDLEPAGYDAETGRLRTNTGVLRYLYEEQGRGTPAIVNHAHPEVLANGCTGFEMRDPSLNRFTAEHPELYADPQSLARVALVAAEMNYINARAGWFDALVAAHVPYDVIPAHRLAAFDLGEYDVVVLRSLLFLSDGDCARLRDFVHGGGTLISTNATSLYDETWRRREDYGLTDVFGYPYQENGPERVEHPFGAGLSILYPGALELEVEADPSGPAAVGLVEDVKSHLRRPALTVDAPPWLAVNAMETAAGTVLHLVNYAKEPVEGVRVVVPGGKGRVEALALEGGTVEVEARELGGGVAITVPRVGRYVVVVVRRGISA